MELARKKRGVWAGALGAAGVTVGACAACCVSLPLLGPLLAWLGIAGLSGMATSWYVAASVLGIGVAALLFVRRRHRLALRAMPRNGTCDCGSSCKV